MLAVLEEVQGMGRKSPVPLQPVASNT